MKQFSKNEKILGLIVLALLFMFIFNALIISPLREKLKTIEQDIARLKLTIRKYSKLELERDPLLKEYKNIERYLSLKGSEDEKITAVLSKVENEAHNAKVTIVDLKPDTAVRSKGFPVTYRIQLNAEADIVKLVNFIYSLENADILLKIDKLNLSVKDEATGIMRLDTAILGVSFS